jgi:hypothetical protein
MLKGNSFTQDTEDERSERLDLLSNNIGDYSVALGLSPAKLLWAQGASDAWEAARSASTIETGQYEEAFEEFNQAFQIALKYYSDAKELLLSIIWELEKPDDFIVAYGFKDSPRSLKSLASAITAWHDNHEILKALVPPDPRIVNDAIVTELVAKRDALNLMQRGARKEYREKVDANAAKRALYDGDAKSLFFVFSLCKLTWGDDDSKLGLLGFVPSSEIWTPGMPVPGGANYPDKPENMKAVKASDPLTGIMVSCDLLNGAATYNIYREKVATGAPRPSRPSSPWMSEIPDPAALDGDVMIGFVYYYWMCGVDETNVEGAFSDAMMEWIG